MGRTIAEAGGNGATTAGVARGTPGVTGLRVGSCESDAEKGSATRSVFSENDPLTSKHGVAGGDTAKLVRATNGIEEDDVVLVVRASELERPFDEPAKRSLR